jgi:hypothetical protein
MVKIEFRMAEPFPKPKMLNTQKLRVKQAGKVSCECILQSIVFGDVSKIKMGLI